MISLEGLQSFNANVTPPEERALAHIKVEVDGQTYNWQIFVPKDTTNLDNFLQGQLAFIQQDIRSKETQWTNLNPKTRIIPDPMTGQDKTVDIQKSEIVRPDVPDYATLRRIEYPSIYDQLDALWKGSTSPEYIAMKNTINEIKTRHAKPN